MKIVQPLYTRNMHLHATLYKLPNQAALSHHQSSSSLPEQKHCFHLQFSFVPMAALLASLSTPFTASPKLVPNTKVGFKPSPTALVRGAPRAEGCGGSAAQRRPSKYQPSNQFIQSIASSTAIETQRTRVEELRREVRQIITSTTEHVAQLELIDTLERFGVAYHFETEIRRYAISTSTRGFADLYSCSLRFRILRQYGYNVSADAFSRFRDQQSRRFSESLREDVRGMLSLYEASQLACEGESVLEEAAAFSSEHLRARISRMDQTFGRYACRWDLQAAERLPQSLRVFYAALYNTTNQISYTVLRRHGRDISSHLRRAWVSVSRAYLVEARWQRAGQTPKLEEYLSNIRAVMATPILLPAYFFFSQNIEEQAVQRLQSESNIINLSSTIVRLSADLQRSRIEFGRGKLPRSVQIYMNEARVAEEQARQHIRNLLRDAWRRLNRELLSAQQQQQAVCSRAFMNVALNIARVSQSMCEYEDGIGVLEHESMDHLYSLIAEPIQNA